MSFNQTLPIGIFDSGVGGIWVLRAIREQMPEESAIYFGDQGHIPYGPRPMGWSKPSNCLKIPLGLPSNGTPKG
jgi:hypothetical protein